ncbi:apicoplast pyruvate carrier 1-like isoform X2 [Ptychodera flava]|uniref:apicoplast pyruvate carrier 1-like isoform X2 n=1 Tax=Ptychodera flava TaxID=63121 RepID=UPI00396A36BC
MSSASRSGRKWRGMVAVVGGILINLSIGIYTTFGNLSPYLTSYIRKRSKPSNLTYEMATWIFTSGGIMQAICVYLGGLLDNKFGARLTVFIGSTILSAGVLLTYFSIKYSFYLVIITYGVMIGIGGSFAYGTVITCGMRWFPQHKGIVSGLVATGIGGSSLLFNQLQTAYINPKNLLPTETPAGKYFDQKEILDRTPTCFLFLGGCCIVLQLIGTLFMVDPPESEILSLNRESTSERLHIVSKGDEKDSRSSGNNLKPSAVVRTRAFWTLWFTFALNMVTDVLVSSMYKVFGQNFILDDHFLALVGSIASVLGCLCRVVWGYLGDRFSFRAAMLFLCTNTVVLMVTFILTREAGKAMFAIWVCAIQSTFVGQFVLFPMAAARSFGEENAGPNYGILFTSVLASIVTETLVVYFLFQHIGWIGLFNFCAGCSLVGGILTFTFNVKTPKGRDI